MISCDKCGAQIDAAVAFCPSCGAENKAATQTQAVRIPSVAHCKGRLQQLGTQKWCYIIILCALLVQLLASGLFDCLQIKMDTPIATFSESASLWHETYCGLGVVMALILLGTLAVVALPLFSRLPIKSWKLNAAAGASGLMLIVTLWMYWDFVQSVLPAEFTFFGYLLIVSALTTIVLAYLVNKALARKNQT